MEHVPSAEHERRAKLELAKAFLREHELSSDQLHEAIHLFLIADGRKTGAFVTAEDAEAPALESLMDKLGLAWHSEPLHRDGTGKSYEVANSKERLAEYRAAKAAMVERNNPKLEADWERTNGEFLGYPPRAVDTFVTGVETGQWPHPFWTELEQGAAISDNVALAMEATDVIPASTADAEVERLGQEIRQTLDAIDPALAASLIEARQRYLQEKRTELSSNE